MLFTSILNPKSEELLWYNADDCIQTKNEFVSNLMSYSRYKFIKSHLRLTDHETTEDDIKDGEKSHYKSKNAIKLINSMVKQIHNPTQKISIDESMIKFKGRCNIKNYMPHKPIKVGLKVFVGADSDSYVFGVKFYDGIKSTNLETIRALCCNIKHKNHILYTDNFYTSLSVAQELKKDGIFLVGTLRSNRGLPSNPKLFVKTITSKLEKNQMIPFSTFDNINMCLYHDRKKIWIFNSTPQHKYQ